MIIRNLATFALLSFLSHAALAYEMNLTAIRGGDLGAPPVTSGHHVYVASGVIVLTYDYTDTGNPVLLTTSMAQPADGPIAALAVHAGHLYASWRRPDGVGGLNIYSLADPASPARVAVIDDYYPDAFMNNPTALAVVGGYLYLNDTENGVFVASLSDPVNLDFQHAVQEFNSFTRFFVTGTLMAATGRGWLGQTDLAVFDISDPAAPVVRGATQAWGNTSFQLDVAGTLAVGAGTHIEVYDFSDPDDILLRSSLELDDPAPLSLIAGDHAYLAGFDDLQVWNVTNPDAPAPVTQGMPSFGMQVAGHTALGPLILSRKDRVILLDTADTASPAVTSDVYIPGGYSAMDVDFAGGMAFMVQGDYGMSVHDAETMQMIAQFEADLPPIYQERAFERLQVAGDHAYLASWGSGVVVTDISNPANPQQAGFLPFPFVSALAIHGDLLYFVTATNDGILGIADISDPTDPTVVSATCINTDSCFSLAYDLVVSDGHAFIATGGPGLHIMNVDDPAQPVGRSVYDACFFGSGVAIDAARELAFLACADGDLHIIDIADLDNPAQVAVYHSTDGFGEGHSVKVDGDIALFGHREGVDLLDIADPADPQRLARNEISWPPRQVVLHGNRVFAFTGPAGYYELDITAPGGGDRIFGDRFQQAD